MNDFKPGQKIEVSMDGEHWQERRFLSRYEGAVYVVNDFKAVTWFNIGRPILVPWKPMSDMPEGRFVQVKYGFDDQIEEQARLGSWLYKSIDKDKNKLQKTYEIDYRDNKGWRLIPDKSEPEFLPPWRAMKDMPEIEYVFVKVDYYKYPVLRRLDVDSHLYDENGKKQCHKESSSYSRFMPIPPHEVNNA